MGSLMDMLNLYREKEANSGEEIEKLQKLAIIKNEEIANLDVEIQSLTDFMNSVEQKQQEKIALFKQEIEENAKVIRRSDKLLVDLQQKNEVTQNAVLVSQ